MSIQTFKVVILGDLAVGKTTWIIRHLIGEFRRDYNPTLGVEVHPLDFNTNHGPIRFNVWDTAGNPNLIGLGDAYSMGADAAILFFDLTSQQTYNSLNTHYNNFVRMTGQDKRVVVCGNKTDIPRRQVMPQDITFHQNHPNCKYLEISAKSNYNLEKPFLHLARELTGHQDLVFVEFPPIKPPTVIDNVMMVEYEKALMAAHQTPLPEE